MGDYAEFLARKAPKPIERGIEAPNLAGHLFPFQRHCVEFLLRIGSGGLFLDTGLGKTACELEWCEHARNATNGRALILTPLAVAKQIEREGRRWGYDARVIRDQSEAREGINICNYDRLHLIDPQEFGAVALDLIDRTLHLWSNPGDVVLSPFMGVGSEGYCSLKARRRFIGVELKESYWRQAVQNLRGASAQQDMFAAVAS